MSNAALPPGKARTRPTRSPCPAAPLARSRPIARARPGRAPVGGGTAGERDGAVRRAGAISGWLLSKCSCSSPWRAHRPSRRCRSRGDGAGERDLLHEQVGVGIAGGGELPGDVEREGAPAAARGEGVGCHPVGLIDVLEADLHGAVTSEGRVGRSRRGEQRDQRRLEVGGVLGERLVEHSDPAIGEHLDRADHREVFGRLFGQDPPTGPEAGRRRTSGGGLHDDGLLEGVDGARPDDRAVGATTRSCSSP